MREATELRSDRRQFVRAALPMTVTVNGVSLKGRDLSLGGMCLIDIDDPFTESEMVKVAINWRDVRLEFVIDTMPVHYDRDTRVQSFKFLSLSKMQASLISLLMHREGDGSESH